MISEILPTRIWQGTVRTEEIAIAVNNAQWDYYQEQWGKSQQFAKSNPFDSDVISEYNMKNLQEEILAAVQQYDPSFRPYAQQSWITRYTTNDYSHIHAHGRAAIAGAVYFKVDNPRGFFFENEHGLAHAIETHQNDLLLFPGYLRHGVHRVTGERIVLSFNLY